MPVVRTLARHSNVMRSSRRSHVAHAQWFDAGFTQGGRGAIAMPYYSAATNGPTAGDEQPAVDVGDAPGNLAAFAVALEARRALLRAAADAQTAAETD